MHVVKNGEVIDTLKLDQDSRRHILFGRCPSTNNNEAAITLNHPTISRTHAALLRSEDGTLFVLDLGSSHGTFVNSSRISPFVATPLSNRETLRFGQSSRTYIIRIFPKCLQKVQQEEEQANTLRNCMVGYKEQSPEQQQKEQESHKMERRVSFSCLEPEIILFQDELAGGSATPVGEESGECTFSSPPETKFRKMLLTPPTRIGSSSCGGEESEDAVCNSSNKRYRRELM